MQSARHFANNTIVRVQKSINSYYRNKAFKHDFLEFTHLSRNLNDRRFSPNWKDRYPCLHDNTSTTKFDAHYIYHTAWAARVLAQTKPSKHIDIASQLPFCAITSAFIPIDFYDFRPAQLTLSGLEPKQGDVTHLPFKTGTVQSISCMHTIEHIGLGRYGDPLDPQGDLKAIKELRRVVSSKGNLLVVVPVGKQTLMFNAHRIYSYSEFLSYFPEFTLIQYALIDDSQNFTIDATKTMTDKQRYGCGCFWLQKKI